MAFTTMISLAATKLSKSYHKVLFGDFTLSIEGRHVIGLIGDNGSGKSTLLRMLAGEEKTDTGSIRWGSDVSLGYLPQELTTNETLSGGQKKISEIRKLIFAEKRNVILLDEPDNHLDIENKIWLEEVIKKFNGLIIMISHDRKLLANVTDQVWNVSEEKVNVYNFGYEKFVDFYQQELEERFHLFKTQEKEKQRLEKLVETLRGRAASNDKFVGAYHSTEKRLEKFKKEMAAPPPKTKDSLGIKVDLDKQHKRKTAILATNISKAYGEKMILEDLKLHLFCGEKVAIMGANGKGKSTLMKILAGVLKPDTGTVEFGTDLKTGYYSQDHFDRLNPENTPIDELNSVKPGDEFGFGKYLEQFLFDKRTSKTQIKYLSGGQRSRVQLAKFLILNPEVLLLDEPTNHLDIPSVESLEKFLLNYQGAFVLISHDRALVENVAQTIYTIEEGKLEQV